jgi:hypothetical protein
VDPQNIIVPEAVDGLGLLQVLGKTEHLESEEERLYLQMSLGILHQT